MTLNDRSVSSPNVGEILAEFGSAHLIRGSAGHLELRGGSGQERAEAREWASLFLDAEYVVWQPVLI